MSFISTPLSSASSRIARILPGAALKSGERGGLLHGALLAFVIRVASAGLAFLMQVLLARWMGAHEFGIFAYVWVWVIVLGTLTPLGLNAAVLRFVPQYREQGDAEKLRGFLFAGRWVSFIAGSVVAVCGAAFLYVAGGVVDEIYLVPFYLAFVCLPLFSLTDFQEGIGRACSWIDLALAPPYILRPVLLLFFMMSAIYAGAAPDVKTALWSAIGASWIVAAAQFLLLRQRLRPVAGKGARRYDFPLWLKVSLPLLLVEGFSLLLFNTDIMVMSHYLGPAQLAHYFAAVKVTGLIGFVYYAVVAASAQRFAQYDAAKDQRQLQLLVKQAARWTFWPSLIAAIVILALGWPLLWLFGHDFTAAWPVMFILTAGLLARAFVGPLDYVLNMLGEQNISAAILGAAAMVNLGLNIMLIPQFGLMGAASATAISFVMVSVLLSIAAHRRLGLGVFSFVADETVPEEANIGNRLCTARIREFSDMRANPAEWQALSDHALAANPVYAPDMALAAYEALFKGEKGLKALCIWREGGAKSGGAELVGFFPFQAPSFPGGVMSSWHHLYSFCSAPLVHKDHADEVFAALLDWLGQEKNIYRLPILPVDGAFHAALQSACAARGAHYAVLQSYERAVLYARDYGADILEKSLSRQRRKTLARQMRRLEENGKVEFSVFEPGDDIAAWTDAFLKLEARGWKGREKTAMLCDDAASLFLRRALAAAEAGKRLQFYSLNLAGRPIAMSMAFQAGDALFFFKMAYDEAYRAQSPGMLLFAKITKTLAASGRFAFADSCSTPDHPLLDHMWPGRRLVGDVLIGPGGPGGPGGAAGQVKFAMTVFMLRLKIRLRARAKRLLYRLRALVK